MTLAELAAASDVPPRSIRFYISRGILPGPLKAGRGAEYGPEHLRRLECIKQLQSEGRTLSQIAASLDETPALALPPPTAWYHHVIADDVLVLTRSDAAPWRTRQIRAALHELAHKLKQEPERKD